jgi:hypothetical protein
VKIAFVGVEGSASGALEGERQALVAYAATDGPTVPQAMGHVPCDTDGDALMGRSFHDTTDVTSATDTAADALPAYAKRARLIIQNTDADGAMLWFDFGTDAIAGACFQCLPGQLIPFEGAACPPDRVSFVADSGETCRAFAKDW